MLFRLLLVLLLVVGFSPVHAAGLAMGNSHAVTLAGHHHAADDQPCPSPCSGESDHCCLTLGSCCAASLPTVANIAISLPSIGTAWVSSTERLMTGRLHRPTTPPPRI